jgi:hypothetical protein
MTTLTRASAAIAMVAAIAVEAGVMAQRPVFKSGVNTVLINVFVRQPDGRPAEDLSATGVFDLRDNGVPQRIESVAIERAPLDVTLVIEAGVTTAERRTRLRLAIAHVSAQLRPDDRLSVFTFSDRVRRLDPATATDETFGALPTDPPPAPPALFEALTLSLMTGPPAGRRPVVLFFTYGRDAASFLDRPTAVEMGFRTDATVEFFLPSDPRSSAGGGGRGGTRGAGGGVAGFPPYVDRLFTSLAFATGGRITAMLKGDDPAVAFASALEGMRMAYVLAYTPQRVTHDGWHQISVKLKAGGKYDVKTHQGYFGS